MRTVQGPIAVLLIFAMLGLAGPATAQDLGSLNLGHQVSPNLISTATSFGDRGLAFASPQSLPTRTLFGARGLAFAPPQSPYGTPANPRKGELTSGGKFLRGLGIGLMAIGGSYAVYVAAEIRPSQSDCNPYYDSGGTGKCSSGALLYYGSAGATAGVGLVLFLVGRTMKRK